MAFGEIKILSNRLPAMDPRMRQAAARVVKSTALQCEALAKTKAPVDTGALRTSIQAQPETELSWVVGPGVDYAIYVEYGTVHMVPQPYMTPAAEQLRGPFIQRMNDAMERAA
jgi:HK97 gp10 family phage protein